MKKKILKFFLIVFFLALLAVVTISADIVFNDGLFFKNAVASSIFSVKNAEDEYMSINLDRTRYLESIVITNAYMVQKAAEEYASYNGGYYPDGYAHLNLPYSSIINPFDSLGNWIIDDVQYGVEGKVSFCSTFGTLPYTIIAGGKYGRKIITLHSSYGSN
ncbi:hypothetical protein JXL83_02880 [candidate division WOR-3 bacterium]|nr:hypothetical protein [candidate division WOR-3 bacterium]